MPKFRTTLSYGHGLGTTLTPFNRQIVSPNIDSLFRLSDQVVFDTVSSEKHAADCHYIARRRRQS